MFKLLVCICGLPVVVFFFFKQKTAYEMRISDWSSDVCSSDLAAGWRIEPPVSVPVAAGQSRAAIAAEDPPEDPPGASAAPSLRFGPPSLRRQGEITLPK